MVEAGGDLGLAAEAGASRAVRCGLIDLEDDPPTDGSVPRLVDVQVVGPAEAKPLDDLVANLADEARVPLRQAHRRGLG